MRIDVTSIGLRDQVPLFADGFPQAATRRTSSSNRSVGGCQHRQHLVDGIESEERAKFGRARESWKYDDRRQSPGK
jgi:hypothetical protein